MQFTDRVTIAGTKKRDDGYLVADARIARTGIQTYLGFEVGKPEMERVRVYRPGSEVFSEDTLKSAAHRPVTNDHPSEAVTADNWKKYAIGQTADEVSAEGIFIRVPLMVADAAAIKDIENGKQELSAGYSCDLFFDSGVTPSGEAYDAIQKNIRINHVAIVSQGRAGSKVRIGDNVEAWGVAPINLADKKGNKVMEPTLRMVIVDGLSVQTTDQGAQAITKLLDDKKALSDKLIANDAAHLAAVAKKDEELGTLKAELQKVKDAAIKPADLDKLVADRSALVTQVKAIVADIKTDGVSDADLRRAVVKAKLGDEHKDAPDAEINGMFKVLAKDAGSSNTHDAFRSTVSNGIVSNDASVNDEMKAYGASVADLNRKPKEAA